MIGRPIEQAQEEEALQLHKKGLKEWKDIWDKENHYWKSRATLIADFNVSNQQINLLGRRVDLWNRGDLWLMAISQKPQLEAFVWKDSSALWPIPKGWDSTAVHTVLNSRWKTLKDRFQWNSILQSLWSKYIEPKKSCLAWLIAFRAIWTNKKALKFHKGNGLCQSCNKVEDDIHIFFQCECVVPSLDRIKKLI